MANYANLKATINANIKANGNEEITGPILNTVLNQAVTTLGAGYQYMGVATPATSPGTPDANVFYIAATPGTYTNFGGKVVADGEVAILKYNGSWAKEVTGAATAAQVTQLGQEVDDFIQPAKEDFAISDDNRNAVLIIDKGEIKTKVFDSAKTPNIGDNNKADLDVTDEEDNILVRFADGHIKTKNFDSSKNSLTEADVVKVAGIEAGAQVNDVVTDDTDNVDLTLSDEDGNSIAIFKDGHIRTKYFNSKHFADASLAGKKVVCIGDSITYGQGLTDRNTEVYHAQLAQKTGCVNNNQGVSGTGLCTNMANGLSGSRFITRATSVTLSNADIIVVFGGTNDFTYDSKAIGSYYNEQTITPSGRIGNKEKVAPTDTDTFSGALHELVTHIRGISDAPIIFITPLHRSNYAADRPNSWQANVNGDYLSDYIDAIKSICADYSVPVLDLYSCYNLDFNDASMRAAFSVDGIHPNRAGHTIICELLYKFIINNLNI